MLAADAFYAIIEAAEGSTSKQPVYQLPEVKLVANQFHKIFLTKGGGSPMTEMFRQFRGRNPTHEALLYSLGLKKTKSFVWRFQNDIWIIVIKSDKKRCINKNGLGIITLHLGKKAV